MNKISVEKADYSGWRDRLMGSLRAAVTHRSANQGDSQPLAGSLFRRPSNGRAYVRALAVVVVCTGLARLMFPHFAPANLIMVYLVGVVIVALGCGRGPAMLASLLSVAAFDFFFVPPYLTFVVEDTEYIITFAVMLLVAVIISTLTVRIKEQAEIAHDRERRTAQLYAMSRAFANSRSTQALMRVAAKHISDLFHCPVVMLLPDAQGHVTVLAREQLADAPSEHDQGVAQWVYDYGQTAGIGTECLPGAQGLYLPLITSRGTAGVLGIYPARASYAFLPDEVQLLETFANQTAVAIERARLAEETEEARVQIETERLRNALLSSISHDLRTPLSAITGAVSSLLTNDRTLAADDRHELAQVAYEEAERLNRLVGNLLEMTRLESGGIQVEKEWELLEEIVGSTLNRLGTRLDDHPIAVKLPPDLPLVPIDSVLIEQVLLNLLDNALKYTPPGSPIELSGQARGREVVVSVADRGPGLPPGDEKRVFDKFYRAQPKTSGGVGLGLTICRGIVEAHAGRIWAENRPSGGARFSFTLPLDGQPPEVSAEDD
jgi:two-component system, OmpR family, sensor histidine kinase KdpD